MQDIPTKNVRGWTCYDYKDLYKRHYTFTQDDKTGAKLCEVLENSGGGAYFVMSGPLRYCSVEAAIWDGIKGYEFYIAADYIDKLIKEYEKAGNLYLPLESYIIDEIQEDIDKIQKNVNNVLKKLEGLGKHIADKNAKIEELTKKLESH